MIKKFIFCFSFIAILSSSVFSQNTLIDEQLAAGYFMTGQYEEASELYEQLYNKTANPAYYQSLLKTYLELGEYKKAERLIEKRLKQNPKDLTLHVDLGRVYSANNNRSKAQKEFKSAISKLAPDINSIKALAEAFENIRELDFAVETYETARKSFQSKEVFIFEILTLYEKSGKYDKMVIESLNLLEESPQRTEDVQLFFQPYFAENNKAVVDNLKKELLKRMQKQPNNRPLNGMVLWFSLQEKDFDFAVAQAIAIDKRFSEENGVTVFQVGEISLANQSYVPASAAFDYLLKKGDENPFYIQSQIKFLEAKFLQTVSQVVINKNDIEELKASYQKTLQELGRNGQTIPLIKNLAHIEGFYANDIQAAADLLYEAIDIPQGDRKLKAECKLELADILFFGNDTWEASLLYMQVEKDFKNDVLGALAKFKNAKLSYFAEDFLWAKTQLEVLRASTSKLIANDAMELSLLISDNIDDDGTYSTLSYYSRADLLAYRNQNEEALLVLDSISTLHLSHPIFDEVLFKKAKIKLKQEKYSEADSLLQKLVDFYPYDILADDALFALAELNEGQLNNQEKALQFYETIILDYPASIYVTEARKRYYSLKGSLPQSKEKKELKWEERTLMPGIAPSSFNN